MIRSRRMIRSRLRRKKRQRPRPQVSRKWTTSLPPFLYPPRFRRRLLLPFLFRRRLPLSRQSRRPFLGLLRVKKPRRLLATSRWPLLFLRPHRVNRRPRRRAASRRRPLLPRPWLGLPMTTFPCWPWKATLCCRRRKKVLPYRSALNRPPLRRATKPPRRRDAPKRLRRHDAWRRLFLHRPAAWNLEERENSSP